MEKIRDEILEIVSMIIDKEPNEIQPNAHLVEDLGADSMMALEILAALEKKYSIIIPEEKLGSLSTVNKIVSLVMEILEKK